MNAERWLIAISAGRWQVRGIRAAQAAGLRVWAIDADADAPGLKIADRGLVADIKDVAAIVAAIDTAGVVPAGAIAFCSEAGMMTTAVLREHYNLSGPRASVVEAVTRKDRQRALWTTAGLPCPRWSVARNAEEAGSMLRALGGDCIMKPVDSAGSRGVTVLPEGSSWSEAFAHALAFSPSGNVIIEQFIVGVEHTIETFSHQGRTAVLAITAKRKVPGTSNTVASELASATLSAAEFAAMEDTCSRALEALGYTDGPGHTEMLRTASGELFLVESAGRGGGFMVADGIVPQASGFDLSGACALQAAGLTPPWPDQMVRRAVVLRFVPSRRGEVRAIEGFSAEDDLPGVISEPLVSIGQKVGQAASDGDRMAFILSTGNELAEAIWLADEKERRIRIAVA